MSDMGQSERSASRLREARAIIERLLIPMRPVKYQPWNTDAAERAERWLAEEDTDA